MKRALFLVVIVTGCAAPRAEKAAAPSSMPAKFSEQDGTGEGAAPSSVSPPPSGADATKMPSTTAAPMPGGGGATGTIVVSDEVSKAQSTFDDASKAFAAVGSDCAQLCKALHSMTHATERLCGLTEGGSLTDQQRCTDARARLDAAKAKVNSTCGSC
jgi:hypothetical protein